METLLTICGLTAAILGTWRSYVNARAALGPLVHEGEPTRSAIEAAWPIHRRSRVRTFVRRVAASVAWLAVAMYGLFLASTGLAVP